MRRQLNLRVSDDFARRLKRVARRTGQPVAAVLEAVVTPALDAAEADARFEAEALEAWEAYQLTGKVVGAGALDGLLDAATARARTAAGRRPRRAGRRAPKR